MTPQFGEYFVASVSFKAGNPRHRVVAFCSGAERFDLFCGGYEQIEKIYLPQILKSGGSFEILAKLSVLSLRS